MLIRSAPAESGYAIAVEDLPGPVRREVLPGSADHAAKAREAQKFNATTCALHDSTANSLSSLLISWRSHCLIASSASVSSRVAIVLFFSSSGMW